MMNLIWFSQNPAEIQSIGLNPIADDIETVLTNLGLEGRGRLAYVM